MNRPRLRGRGDTGPLTPLALGGTTAWALAVWSAYIATWAWVSGSSPFVVVAWWLAGVCAVKGVAPRSARSGAADGEREADAQDEPAPRDALS